MLRLESSWHGRSVDHVLTYSELQIAVGSQKPSRITTQKTCCASQTRRFALYSRTGVVLMPRLESSWHGRSVDHVPTYSGRQIAVGSQKPSRITRQNTGCASESNTSDEKSRSDLGNLLELRGKRLVAQVSQTRRFALYSRTGVVLMLRLESSWHGRSVDHVLTYFGRQIAVGSLKPSQITSQKTCCASESNTLSSWHGRSVGHVSTYFGRQIAVGSKNPSRITRQKTCCASESNTSIRVVFVNGSGFDAPLGVVLAWEERGSCLNIFRTTNRGRISETFTNYEAKDLLRKRIVAQVSQTRRFALYSRTGVVLVLRLESSWHGRSVGRVSTYSGRQIAVGSQKPSRITRQKTCCASESNTSVRVVFANGSGFDAPIGVVLVWEERGSCLNIFRTTNRGRISETFTNYEAKDLLRKNLHELRGKRLVVQVSQTRRFALYSRTGVVLMLRLESSWHGRSVDHVLTYSGRLIAVGSQKPSRITRQNTCCASESNRSVRVVFANQSGLDAPIGVFLAWEERGSCLNIFRTKNRGRISETFSNYEAKDLLRKVVLTRRLESCWHGRNVDHVSTYSGRQIAVGSLKPSRITRQKTCCASESNTSVGVVFANRSGFDAPIGVIFAWEERGSILNIFRTKNRDHRNLLELRLKRLVAQVSQTHRFALYSRTGVVLMLRLESSWHGRSVDHVLTYSGRQIAVGSQKSSRITRQKTCCASESNTSVRVVLANGSGFDAPIGVVLAWEERGSCLSIFRTTNRDDKSRSDLRNLHELRGQRLVAQVSQTRRFALYSRTEVVLMLRLESSWHGWSVDHVLTYSGRQIAVGSLKPSRITRQKTCCASESNTSVRVVFTNQSGFDAPIGVVLAWEERGSCPNIFRTTNRGQISETFTNYEAKDLLSNFWTTNHGRSQNPSRITRQNTCCASESNTSVRVVFANQSGFDAPIGVILAWDERGSCPNIFRTTNCVRISETFTNYEANDLLRKSTDLVLTYSELQLAVGSLKPSRITRQKTCCASESNMSVRIVFANRSGFDAPIGVVFAWEERGSSLNIFRTTNRGPISETFTDYEIAVGSQKPSRITRQKNSCANESNTSVRVVFANRSGFDAPIGVILAWEEHGSCLNIFRTTNRVQISETFMNYEAKDLLRKSVDHFSTYSGRKLAVRSQKPSRITRQKTCCASESNASVRVVFADGSGFVAPIGLVLAWEERGSCLNIFWTTNHGRISETFTNYEAKDLLCNQKTCCASESNTSVRVVFSNGSGFDAPIGVVLAWEECGSCLNIFRTINRGRISETFTNYKAKDLLRKVVLMLRLESSWHGTSVDRVLTYSGRQIAFGSQKPSRIMRQMTCCASESNTSVRVVFANRSGFDAPIGVVLAWGERGSCINIFRTKNRGRISKTFTNYEAKDSLRK
ncbi:uncharacterized protein G2W53_009794 [Senna tora]|uniref:Uncharacterized protein n=1 Tax=Senna tora TaxID=362788 RepID=A0A834WY45_9FABA|nr:uncharacterized protein G2W53_009794 [Senna tora]